MKNGTRFNPSFARPERGAEEQERAEDAATDPRETRRVEDTPLPPLPAPPLGTWLFAVLSVALAGGAVAAGVQAVRLARLRATRRALTDVQDLLRTCQDRMSQMERDLRPPTARA